MTRFVIILFIIFLSACGGKNHAPADPVAEKLTFSGIGDLGIFDPSITLDSSSGRLWMSYSSINTSPNYSSSVYWAVSTRLAYSDDDGASWQDSGVVVSPTIERTDFGPDNTASVPIPSDSNGIWQSEMSSLVYDSHPSTPASERWKLIWVQYLHAGSTSYFADYSWIAMKMASTPTDLASAPTVKLFGGAGLKANNTNIGPPVYSPVASAPVIQLNTGITNTIGPNVSELNLCIFAEPGLHATANDLYMIIYCADAVTNPVTEYIVSFRCNSPCTMTNAANWTYLGRTLSPTDAQAATGDHHYQAPAIVEKSGKTYLIVTTVDTSSGSRYNGCRVYEFTDINNNQLRRSGGQLVEVARVTGEANTHHGACAAYKNLSGGILLSQFGTLGTADTFTIYKSQVSLP
jgi:hypothetical protein